MKTIKTPRVLFELLAGAVILLLTAVFIVQSLASDDMEEEADQDSTSGAAERQLYDEPVRLPEATTTTLPVLTPEQDCLHRNVVRQIADVWWQWRDMPNDEWFEKHAHLERLRGASTTPAELRARFENDRCRRTSKCFWLHYSGVYDPDTGLQHKTWECYDLFGSEYDYLYTSEYNPDHYPAYDVADDYHSPVYS